MIYSITKKLRIFLITRQLNGTQFHIDLIKLIEFFLLNLSKWRHSYMCCSLLKIKKKCRYTEPLKIFLNTCNPDMSASDADLRVPITHFRGKSKPFIALPDFVLYLTFLV